MKPVASPLLGIAILVIFGISGVSWFLVRDSIDGFTLHSLVATLGITTLTSVAVTFSTGVLRKRFRGSFLKIHFTFALLSVILGLIHGGLVIFFLSE
jgi:Kef-type K+ transport system membrane component KefB